MNNKKNKILDIRSLNKLITSFILFILLLVFLILFINERNWVNKNVIYNGDIVELHGKTINDLLNTIPTTTDASQLQQIYTALLSIAAYPLIDFSLMKFLNSNSLGQTDLATQWTQRSNDITLAYSYMFIAMLIALVGVVIYFFINFVSIFQIKKEKQYGLTNNYLTSFLSYKIFKWNVIADFVLNLAIVFSFFNFLSTLIIICYWFILFGLNLVFSKLIKSNNNDFVVSYKENKSNFMYLIFILIFQNAYSILKIIFASNFGVNLDLIFQIILPIGTITVIVSLFIKNLLSSKVNDVFKAIKNIHGVIDSLMVFYYSKKEVAFDDYNFVSSLPSLIKTQILNNQISTKEASALIEKFDTTIKLIDQTYSKDEKQKKYMWYVLLNKVSSNQQFDEMIMNINKVKNGTK